MVDERKEKRRKKNRVINAVIQSTSSNTLTYVLIGHLIEFFTLNKASSFKKREGE
jgi:hypothetical protein